MPLGWKLFAPLFNAAYRPGKLDQLAAPQPDQPQFHIPSVEVDNTGRYEINFGSGRRFYNGTLQIHYQGQWFYAHPLKGEKSIKLIAIEKTSTSDAFGTANRILIKWELEGISIPVETNIFIYPNQSILKFQLNFPSGIKNVSTNNLSDLIFRFPCFDLEGPNRRVLLYRDAMFCPPSRKIPKKGTQGPIVFYDNELNAAVLGPMDHFMLAFTKKNENIYHGLEGLIQEIPEGFSHSVLLLFTQGINKAIVDWCAFLQKYYDVGSKNPYDDPVLAYLGFWTQNGAYYYYRKEKGMTYEQTISYACQTFKEKGIPFRYFQLDSWWYQKTMKSLWKYPPFSWLGRLIGGGAYGGTLLWEPIPEEFPDGMKALHQKIGLPFACHARWFSPKSPYLQKYQSIIGKIAALPMEAKFWDNLMKQAAEWGLIMYEQDWLRNTFSRLAFLKEDINAAENWLTWMAEAAKRNNITIQYCMAPSGAFLYALKFPAVTNARVTGDYHARVTKQFFYPQFSQTNILAWGVGIWPSLDCYLTTTMPLRKGLYREKYPEQMTLLSNLGGGVICPADKAERVNKELLMKTCNNEGVLLKPDRPITANDLMFKINHKPYIMDTWTQKGNWYWRYIVIVNLWPRRVKDPQVTLGELGYNEKGILFNFITEELREIGFTDVINLELKRMGYKYFIFAPFLTEGVALIGAYEKFVTCANKLIPEVEVDSLTLKLSVEYSPNSQLKLLIYSRIIPQDVKLNNNSASLEWDYDPSTFRLIIMLNFSKSNSTKITLVFNK